MFLKAIILNITILISVYAFFSNLDSYSGEGYPLIQTLDFPQDSLAVEENEMLFVIDGKELFMKKSELMKKLNLDDVLHIKVQQKPIPTDLLEKYGKRARNGIITITLKAGKKEKILD